MKELKEGHFYWIKYFDTITIGQCEFSRWGGAVGTRTSFNWVGSDEPLDIDEVIVLSSAIPFPVLEKSND